MDKAYRSNLARSEGVEARPAARPAASPELSVVIPVHNEEPCLEELWQRLREVLAAVAPTWEVILVDDESSDGSLELLKRFQRDESRLRVVALKQRQGQTAALAAGFRFARGEWVLTLDADLQNPPEEIPKLLAATDGVDLVYGRRQVRVDSLVKRVSSHVGNGVRNWITGHRVRDTGCSLKLFRRKALERIPMFHGMHRFLPTLFAFHGFRGREVEVAHASRAAGRTKYGMANRAWRGLIDCFAVRWMRGRSLRYEAHEFQGFREEDD